jgi:hypothetical protein
VYFFQCINIICNIYLFKYLDRNTERNIALKPMDKKAERKKNLYPAWLGVITFGTCTFIYLCFSIIYSFPAHLLDSGTNALFTGFVCDLFQCIITPGVIMFGSQTGRRRIHKMKGKILENMS